MTEMTFREYHERQQLLMEDSKWTVENIINALQNNYAKKKGRAIASLATRSDKFTKEEVEKILNLLKGIDPKEVSEDDLEKAISRLSNNELTAEEKTDKSKTQVESQEVETEVSQWKYIYDFWQKYKVSTVISSGRYELKFDNGGTDNELDKLFEKPTDKFPFDSQININSLSTSAKNYIVLFFMFIVKIASINTPAEERIQINDNTIIDTKDGKIEIDEKGNSAFSTSIKSVLDEKIKLLNKTVKFNPASLKTMDNKFGEFDFKDVKQVINYFDTCVTDGAMLKKLLINIPNLENSKKEEKTIDNITYTKEGSTWKDPNGNEVEDKDILDKLNSISQDGSTLNPNSGTLNPDGSTLNPDGDTLNPDGDTQQQHQQQTGGSDSNGLNTFSNISYSSSNREIQAAYDKMFPDDPFSSEPIKHAISQLTSLKEKIQSRNDTGERQKKLKSALKESYSPIFEELIHNPLLSKTKEDLERLNEARITSVNDDKAEENWNTATSNDVQNPILKIFNKYKKSIHELIKNLSTPGELSNSKAVKAISDIKDLASKYLWEINDYVLKTAKDNDLGAIGKLKRDITKSINKKREIDNRAYASSKKGAIALATEEAIKANINVKNIKELSDDEKKVIRSAVGLVGNSGDKRLGNQFALSSYSVLESNEKSVNLQKYCLNVFQRMYAGINSSLVVHVLRIIKGDEEMNKELGNNSLTLWGPNSNGNDQRPILIKNTDLNSKNFKVATEKGKELIGKGKELIGKGKEFVGNIRDKADDLINTANAKITAWKSGKSMLKTFANNAINKFKRNNSVMTEAFEYYTVPMLFEDGEDVQVRTADAEKAVLMALSNDQGTAAQGKKWIVDNMYKGNPEAEKLVDEFVKENLSKRENADNALRNNQKVAPAPGGNPIQNNQQNAGQQNTTTAAGQQNTTTAAGQSNQQTPSINPSAPALPQQAMANQQQNTATAVAQNNQQAPAQATVTTGAADGFPNRLYKKLIRRKIGM